MSPMPFKHHGEEEEKVPFISSGPDQDESASAHCPSEVQKHSGKMPPLRRVTMIIGLSLLVGLGLSLAKDLSLSTSCMRWAHIPYDVPTKITRTALNKRQDGSLRNATTSASTTSSAVVVPSISSSPPVVTAPSSTAILPSLSPVPATTSTSSATAQQPQPPSTSTTSTIAQAPPETKTTATTPSQNETPTAPRPPESSATTVPTTSSVLPASTSQVIPTSTKLGKTITAGRVWTSTPVAEILTTTLDDGGILTITSTSWVAVVPTGKPTSSSEPKLQNAAPKSKGHCNLVLAVGVATLGMLLFR